MFSPYAAAPATRRAAGLDEVALGRRPELLAAALDEVEDPVREPDGEHRRPARNATTTWMTSQKLFSAGISSAASV